MPTLQNNSLAEHFSTTKNQIDLLLKEMICSYGSKNMLRDACEYALLSDGKRFRPAVVTLIAKALGSSAPVEKAALSIELFHTASLIADDLPCMDNDDFRRDRPSLHKAFSEETALLASYTLIAAGYEQIALSSEQLAKSHHFSPEQANLICRLAVQSISENTGLLGACGGQYLDIHPEDLSIDSLLNIIKMKTVTLFEIAFVLGWLYGGGEVGKLDQVKQLAYSYGIAFQIADDFGDMGQDLKNERKVNIPARVGEEAAKKLLLKEVKLYQETLKNLSISSIELLSIGTQLLKAIEPL